MTLTLEAWVKSTTGRLVNVDGQFGGQCWDLWSDYAVRVLGVPYEATVTRAGGTDPHPGYACNVYHHAARALGEWLDVLPADREAKRGDVAFWERGALYPGSHVAIVLADNGPTLTAHSQNPNLPSAITISKRDLLGYLRPRKGPFMALTDKEQAELLRLARELWRIHIAPGTAFPYDAVLLSELRALRAEGVTGQPIDPERLAESIAAAIPDDLAEQVADELAARLGTKR